jgi:hypothetical protein
MSWRWLGFAIERHGSAGVAWSIAQGHDVRMVNAIVITSYEHTDPQRVFWVVLKNNLVVESAMEYASGGELQRAFDTAVENARASARLAGLPDDVTIEYWEGTWPPADRRQP